MCMAHPWVQCWLDNFFHEELCYLIFNPLGSPHKKQVSADIFCRESDSKYLRLLQTIRYLLQLLSSAVVAGK